VRIIAIGIQIKRTRATAKRCVNVVAHKGGGNLRALILSPKSLSAEASFLSSSWRFGRLKGMPIFSTGQPWDKSGHDDPRTNHCRRNPVIPACALVHDVGDILLTANLV
jgi:hypothetical protein